MKLSYTEGRNLFGTLTSNDESANLTLGDQLMGIGLSKVYGRRDWSFLEVTETLATETDNVHEVPNSISKLKSVTVLVGTTRYSPRLAASRQQFDALQISASTSDAPEYWYPFASTVSFFPAPATAAGGTISFHGRRRGKRLSIADYTTGTATVTNGATTVTGSGTTWTAAMAGRWIRITETSTAGASGDHEWYEISSVASATSLTLKKPYLGTTVSSGTAYTIGQMSFLPDDYQALPLWFALREYYSTIQPDANRATLYRDRFDQEFGELEEGWLSKTMDPGIDLDGADDMENPNLFVTA